LNDEAKKRNSLKNKHIQILKQIIVFFLLLESFKKK